jgi:hypothetical protein
MCVISGLAPSRIAFRYRRAGILPVFLSTQQRQNDLQNQIHRKLVYRPFQFHKRSPHFIGTNNETFSVAMRVNNPDRLPFKINC